MGKQAFEGDVKRLNGFMFMPEAVVIVGGDGPNDVDKKDEDGNLHFLYDERVEMPLSEEFVLNVMSLGVKKNVIVTKIGEAPYVVDGRQRVRAAREANRRLAKLGEPLLRVPGVQQKGEEPLLMTIGVSTNEFNHEDSALGKARKAQRLRDRGLDDEEIATAFGVTARAISNWGKLLGLAPPVKKAVASGAVSASAAAQLHDLPISEQKAQLDSLIAASKANGAKAPTINQVKASARKAKGQETNQAPSKKVLRFIVEKKEHEALSEDFIAGVAFAIGLRDPKSINGLTAVMKAAKKVPAKKRGAKAPTATA